MERDAVDLNLTIAVAAPHRVAADADHPLDEVALGAVWCHTHELQSLANWVAGRGRHVEPVTGVGEDDDVATLHRAKGCGELADEDPVVLVQCVLHRTRGDVEDLSHKSSDQGSDNKGNDNNYQHLGEPVPPPPRACGHGEL